MKKAYGYTRLATIKQNETNPNEAQAARISEYCKKLNIQLLGTYSETVSGIVKKKPQLKLLIDKAISNKVNYVIITDTDRISRDYHHYAAIKALLGIHDVELKVLNENSEKALYADEIEKVSSIAKLYTPKGK